MTLFEAVDKFSEVLMARNDEAAVDAAVLALTDVLTATFVAQQAPAVAVAQPETSHEGESPISQGDQAGDSQS